jgi:hypothetical protein
MTHLTTHEGVRFLNALIARLDAPADYAQPFWDEEHTPEGPEQERDDYGDYLERLSHEQAEFEATLREFDEERVSAGQLALTFN